MAPNFMRMLIERNLIEFMSNDHWVILDEKAMTAKPFIIEFDADAIVCDSARNSHVMRVGDKLASSSFKGLMRVPGPNNWLWRSFSKGHYPDPMSSVVIMTKAGPTIDFWRDKQRKLQIFKGDWLKVDHWIDPFKIEQAAHQERERIRRYREASR